MILPSLCSAGISELGGWHTAVRGQRDAEVCHPPFFRSDYGQHIEGSEVRDFGDKHWQL